MYWIFIFCGSKSETGSDLQLLDVGHVVAQHAFLQHGDGVALTAHLLDLLPRAVAEGQGKG